MYKVMIAEYMRRESELKQQVLELTMENAELKDMVLDNGGDYTETDGLEVGKSVNILAEINRRVDFEIVD